MDRVGPDVAEAAGHADPVGPHEALAQVVAGVGVVALRIPGLALPFRRRPDSGTAAGPRSRCPSRSRSPAGRFLPRAPSLTPGYFCLVLEGVGRAVGAALVEPQAEAVRVRPLGLLETGLVDQAVPLPPVVAAELRELRALRVGVGGDRLQEIEGPRALVREDVPQAVVPRGPHDPVVAADDLGRRQGHAAVHVVVVVLVRAGERCGVAAGQAGLVHDAACLAMAHPVARATRNDGDEAEEERQAQPVRTVHSRPSFVGASKPQPFAY